MGYHRAVVSPYSNGWSSLLLVSPRIFRQLQIHWDFGVSQEFSEKGTTTNAIKLFSFFYGPWNIFHMIYIYIYPHDTLISPCFWDFLNNDKCLQVGYPLVNVHKTMERSTIFLVGKVHEISSIWYIPMILLYPHVSGYIVLYWPEISGDLGIIPLNYRYFSSEGEPREVMMKAKEISTGYIPCINTYIYIYICIYQKLKTYENHGY